MKKLKKIIKITLFVILAIIFVASLFLIILSVQQKKNAGVLGYTFDIVQTNSMEDTIMVGDIVIGKVMAADTVIKEGDIITFNTTVNNKKITKTHRVSKVWEEGSYGTVYQTWGDNREVCPTPDSGFRTREEVVSVYTGKKIDGLGKVITFLKTPAGYLALALPIAIYIIYEIFCLISIFMANKKEQMLEDTNNAKDEIIREYLEKQRLAQEQAAQEQKANDPNQTKALSDNESEQKE